MGGSCAFDGACPGVGVDRNVRLIVAGARVHHVVYIVYPGGTYIVPPSLVGTREGSKSSRARLSINSTGKPLKRPGEDLLHPLALIVIVPT